MKIEKMDIDTYLKFIHNNQIPPESPSIATPDGYGLSFDNDDWLKSHRARDECTTKYGLWTVIDKVWVGQLAEWIGTRQVLEVMAGAGWLAKALVEYKVKIVATDDFSWNGNPHPENMKLVYPVEKLDALQAINKNPADILLISWPPYEDNTICQAGEIWGGDKPIIYIGENEGGCNAPDGFFDRFQLAEDMPEISLKSWPGIHDHVFIGHFG